jgi:LacI family transcriptional regulator
VKDADQGQGAVHRATLKEVAHRAGVSINTASVVLNPRRNQAVVHPDTRVRVQEAARELGYRRNLAASRLAGGAANTFCIVTDRMTNYFYSVILDAFVSESSREGFQCVLGCTEPADAKSLEYIRGLSMQGVDGFVLVPVWDSPAIAALMPGLLEGAVRTLFLDYRFPGHDAPLVACDHRAGGRALAEHLVSRGHRRVLYLRPGGGEPVWSISERIAGANDVIRDAGGALEVVSTPSMDADAAAGAVLPLLRGTGAPTAVMCANDHLAFSLIAGLNRSGLHIIGKLAVTGFDDVNSYLPELPEFPRDLPFPWEMPLTTIRQPMEELGRRAARELIALARGGYCAPNTDILLPGQLVVRESTAHLV